MAGTAAYFHTQKALPDLKNYSLFNNTKSLFSDMI